MSCTKDNMIMSVKTLLFATAILALAITLLFITSVEESTADTEIKYDGNDNTYEFTDGTLVISASSTGHTGTGTTGVFSNTYSVNDMFSDVQKVVISDDITHIGDYTFYYCTSLQTVELPSTLQSIDAHAFDGCSNLISVTIPDNVTSIGDSAFDFCEELTTVSIGAGVQTIGDSAFRSCYSITSLTVDLANDYFRVGGSNDLLSSDCTILISCPSAVSYSIPNSVAIVCDHAFDYNVNLTDVSVPANLVTLGECPFRMCYNLQSITVDEDNTEYMDQDGVLFNKLCTELILYPSYKSGDSYEIPNTVLGIAKYAFHTCRILSSVTVPASVTMINEYALSSYASPPILSSITFLGSTPAENYCEYGYAKLYVPDVVTYRTAWDDYALYIYQKIVYDSGDTTFDGNPRAILNTAQATVNSGTNTATIAGDYSVTATPKISDGYVWDDGSNTQRTISWSIKPITITSASLNAAYDDFDYDGTIYCPDYGDFQFVTDPSTPALTSSDINISLKTGSDGKNAGTQYVVISAANTNYAFGNGVPTEFDFDILPLDLILTPNSGQSKTYNGTALYELTYTYTGNLTGETPGITGKFSVPDKNVGTRTIGSGTVQLADNGSFKASNYTMKFSTTPVTMTITKATLEVTADDKMITYGDAAPEYTASYDGFVNGEDVSVLGGSLSFACDYDYYDPEKRIAQSYTIAPSGLTSGNYDISFTDGFLFVNRLIAELSWHLGQYTSDLVYTGLEKTLEAWVDNSLFGDVVNVTVSLTPDKDNVNVGKFTYLAQTIDNGNYTVSASGMPVESPEFEITAADITGTLIQTGALYYMGSPQAAATTGLTSVNSQTITITYCTDPTGTYGNMPEFTNADNYTIYYKANAPNHSEKTGSLTVSIKEATLPAIPEKTVSYTGSCNFSTENFETGVNNEKITLRYQSSSADADRYYVGVAEKYCTIWYDGLQNYTFSTVGDLVIEKVELTPSVDLSGVSSKIYDGTASISGASIALSGAVNSEEPTASAAFALASKDVGTTDVNATDIVLDGSWGTNYFLSSTTATGSKGSSLVTVRTVPISNVFWINYTGDELTYQKADLSSLIYAAFFGQGSDGMISLTISFLGTSGAAEGETSFIKAGKYTATGMNTDTNYELSDTCTYTYQIAKKDITSSVKSGTSVTKTYDGTADNTSSLGTYYEFQTIETGDIVTLDAFLAYNSKDVLSAVRMDVTDLDLSGADAGNYNLITESMVINDASITPKALTMTIIDKKQYDGTVLEHTIVDSDASGLISGESFTKGKIVTIGFSTGPYTEMGTEWEISEALEVTGGIGNYDVSFTEVVLQIYSATITVTPDSGQSKMYSTEDPVLTFTYSGQPPSMTPGFKGALGRDAGENIGLYEINAGSLELTDNGTFIASNFILKVVSGVDFEIVQKNIQLSDFNIDFSDEIYTGSAITKTVTSTLKAGIDYTVTYDNNVFVGKAEIWIEGIGNCKGTVVFHFNIVKRTITVPDELYYIETGEEIAFKLPVSDYYTETTGRPQKGTDAGTYPYEFLLDPNCIWSVSGYDGKYNVYITEEYIEETDESGTMIVCITGSKGIRTDLTLNVNATEDVSDIQKNFSFNEGEAKYRYDITFTKDGNVVQPVGKITVKLLIPKNLRMVSFEIYHIHDGTATKMDKTVSGDYVTVETDDFSDFVFVSNFELKTIAILGTILAIITVIALYLICIRKGKGYVEKSKPSRSERRAKKKAEKKTKSK